MCRRVTCSKCSRPTYAGCGAHIEQVLGDVPKAQRCQGHEKQVDSKDNQSAPQKSDSWLKKIFG